MLNNNKKIWEKQRRNYISNLRKQDKKLKLKVKLFTNKNGGLERKINKSTSAMAKNKSEDHSEESCTVFLFFIYLFIYFFSLLISIIQLQLYNQQTLQIPAKFTRYLKFRTIEYYI